MTSLVASTLHSTLAHSQSADKCLHSVWSVCRAPICGASDQDQVQAELEPREKPLSNARHWTLTLTHPVRIFLPHPTLTLPLHPIILSFCIFVHPILPFGSDGNRRFESLLHCHCCSSLKLLESGLWTLLSAQCSLVKRLSSEPLLFCHPHWQCCRREPQSGVLASSHPLPPSHWNITVAE